MRPMRDILVIEDERIVAQAVEMVCKAEGMSITVVDNANAALRELKRAAFRLVLCDIMLPGMNGFEFLDALDEQGVSTPVVMMTGYSTMENAVRSLSMGAVDYFPKPFTADELLTMIRRSFRCGELLAEIESAGLGRKKTIGFVPCPTDYYRLGYVSWAVMEDEGTARIGISDLFLKAVGGISGFELEEPGEELVQGTSCAVATTVDESVHGIMSPMSGTILEVNSDARSHPDLVEKDPYFKGWLYRILPPHPDSDLRWLSL